MDFLLSRKELIVNNQPNVRLEALPDTYTENGAPAFTTTNSKCLDLFASLVRTTNEEKAIEMFKASWNENPSLTMQILLHLRDCRNGKGEKKLSQDLFYFLSTTRPKTYLNHLEQLVLLGYHKDLLKIACKANSNKRQFDVNCPLEISYFAQLLKEDVDKEHPSLAGKWCPSEGSKYDKEPYKFALSLCKELKMNRKEYRKFVSSLREKINVVERNMALQAYDNIKFEQVPSKAHNILKTAFNRDANKKGDETENRKMFHVRYKEYLESLKKGETTIKSTSIEPHTLISKYSEYDEVVESQWKDIVNKLLLNGGFKNVMAICDVSGSMMGDPMNVAVALGLIVSELTAEPFKNKLITFSREPTFHNVVGNNLLEKVKSVRSAPWGMNTDLLKVFKLMLDTAKFHNVKNEDMIKTLFIFTDMQFDNAETGNWNTTYTNIKSMYSELKYDIPNIVFWNLRDTSVSFPVKKDSEGVALISGFSPLLLKYFMTNPVKFDPLSIMTDMVSSYKVNMDNDEMYLY